MSGFTHIIIKETAIKLAQEFYEMAAHDNTFYHFYPEMEDFVQKRWNMFLKIARQSLSACLASPTLPDSLKEPILDALLEERFLPKGGKMTHLPMSALRH